MAGTPANNNKRKARSTADDGNVDKTVNSSQKKAASRGIEVAYTLPTAFRGHAKECGDATIFPCGKVIHVDSHIRDCEQCDAMRFIMDSWQTELKSRSTDDTWEKPPAVTMACMQVVLKKMSVTWAEVRSQADDWNPFKPVMQVDEMTMEKEPTSQTIVQVYEALPAAKKQLGIRPSLPYPAGFELCSKTAKVAPVMQAQLNTKNEAMVYLIENAINDGLINQDCINAVMLNCGLVPQDHEEYEDLVVTSKGSLDKVYKSFQFGLAPSADEFTLSGLQHSPRALATGDSMPVPVKQQQRLTKNGHWSTSHCTIRRQCCPLIGGN